MLFKHLYEEAKRVSKNASAQITGYRVGCVIVDSNGKSHVGCNVESDILTNTIHAEINALSSMIASGGANKKIEAVVVYVTDNKPQFPCGLCRQAIYEYARDDGIQVITYNHKGEESISTIGELLPYGFRLNK